MPGPSFFHENDGAIRRVELRLIGSDERERWDRTMCESHYLKSVGLIGESLRYVAVLDGEWVALIGWCGAAFKCGPREEWIGWPEMVQWRRLRYVANNARFLIVPAERMANLASRVLGMNVRRLSSDWRRVHGHEVLVAETFVDPRRFTGTCYRAAGWLALGMTRGFARSAGTYVAHGEPKRLFVRPLRKNAVAHLRDPMSKFDEEAPMGKFKLDGRRIEKLLGVLMRIPDPRDRKGRLHPASSLLAIAVCAVLSGANGYQEMAEFAARLTQRERRRLDCRKNPKTGEFDVASEHGFRGFLPAVDVEAVDRALGPWLSSLFRGKHQAIAIDGKTCRASGGEGEQIHLLSAVVHGTRVTLAQREVGAKKNEITEAPLLLADQNLEGVVVTADAMHTQKEFARYVVEKKKADYVLTVKDNQPTLKKEIEELFEAGSFPPSG